MASSCVFIEQKYNKQFYFDVQSVIDDLHSWLAFATTNYLMSGLLEKSFSRFAWGGHFSEAKRTTIWRTFRWKVKPVRRLEAN